MNTTRKLTLSTLALLGLQFSALADDGFSMTTGNDSKANTPGLFTRPSAEILPINSRYEAQNLVYQFKVNYLRSHATVGSTATDLKLVQSEHNGDVRLLSGYVVSDSVSSVTYKVPKSLPGNVKLDVTGGLQLKNLRAETANVAIQRNYSVQFDFTRKFGAFSAETGVGYKLREKQPGDDFRDSASAYLGGHYDFTNRTSVELYYDLRQSAFKHSPNEAELTAYINHQLPGKNLSLQGYAFKGVSQNYGHAELGVALKMSF